MKIVHIINGINDGGAAQILFNVCENNADYRHVVVTLTGSTVYKEKMASPNVILYEINMHSLFSIILGFFKIILIIRMEKPNVVQTWLYHSDLIGGLAAIFAGNKNIVWGLHSSYMDGTIAKRGTLIIRRVLAVLSYFIPAKIIVCSKAGILEHARIGYNAKKMHYIPNGYNVRIFKPSPDKSYLKNYNITVERNMPILGSVGRYHVIKDYPSLLQALYEVKKKNRIFKCILVGTGLDRDNYYLSNLISNYDLTDSVFLLGRCVEVQKIMNSIDVHILSSISEAFPNVVAEAMSCGTPSIVTDVGDSSDLVGSTGWVVQPKDPIGLSNAIILALDEFQSNKWSSRCTAARTRVVDNFTDKVMISRYDKLWHSVVSKTCV